MIQYLFSRSITFTAAGELADTNALKTSIATALTVQTYTGGALNGTSTVGTVNGEAKSRLASWPSVTASAVVGAYTNGSTVTFTGTYGGQTVDRVATITATGGGATYIANGPLDLGSVTSIVVGAQADTDGALEFGWSGVGPRYGSQWLCIAREDGNLIVGYSNGESDTVPLADNGLHGAYVSRVYATTAIDFTAYE